MDHREQPFIDAINADPTDPTPKLIYADWLDEQGDPRGQAIRVIVERGWQPHYFDDYDENTLIRVTNYEKVSLPIAMIGWQWMRQRKTDGTIQDESGLPEDLYWELGLDAYGIYWFAMRDLIDLLLENPKYLSGLDT